MPSIPGKLIVIEGLEGAGKSTAMQTVLDLLTQHAIKTCTTREPGGTAIGEELRSIIKNPKYHGILTNQSELLLFYAARTQLVEQVIKPALQEGIWVIADRFELSTFAYQCGGRGVSQELVKQISAFCLNGLKADRTLYLDISPELGMQRAMQRGSIDRIEQESMTFFHRVHQVYQQCVQSDPDIMSIDASLPLDEVQNAIRSSLSLYLEQVL